MGNLFWVILIGLGLHYWWQSGQFKGRARLLATHYCKQHDLQLLDDSMVIVEFRPRRIPGGALVMKRTYQFEFTSTGQQRYQGRLVMLGMKLKEINLDAYRLPDS